MKIVASPAPTRMRPTIADADASGANATVDLPDAP